MSGKTELVDRTVRDTTSGSQEQQQLQQSSSQLDSSLQHFSDPSFDPVDYLNDTLPPLTINGQTPPQSAVSGDRATTSLADLSTQAQSLVSQLNAQSARLSHTLTQLTDEIVRGGGRLAYEVEVLRGETIGLSDAVTETLQDDISRFVPGGLHQLDQDFDEVDGEEGTRNGKEATDEKKNNHDDDNDNGDPEYVTQLRTLSLVKDRLDEVVRIFGEAMEWPVPPSEISVASSFISVSAPEHGFEDQSLEDKGREGEKKLRAEITELLDSEGGGEAGLAAASQRLESLRQLASVWKGTAEERARVKVVEGLAKIVEDRRRTLENQARERETKELRRGRTPPYRKGGTPSSAERPRDERAPAQENSGSGGLFRNLQRLRDEIYLD